MKIIIEIEIDEAYEEQIYEGVVFDQKDVERRCYEDSMKEHALRAVLEQVDGCSPKYHFFNSNIPDSRIMTETNALEDTKIDFLMFCELDDVKVKIKM